MHAPISAELLHQRGVRDIAGYGTTIVNFMKMYTRISMPRRMVAMY